MTQGFESFLDTAHIYINIFFSIASFLLHSTYIGN